MSQVAVAEPPTYLLVYHVKHGLAGAKSWLKSDDSELRVPPITWGDCRPNVRRYLQPGAELFFVAYDKLATDETRTYLLVARLMVRDLVEQSLAASQFHERPNVLLDQLPAGGSTGDRVVRYALDHRAGLRWWDDLPRAERESRLGDLLGTATRLRAEATEQVVLLDDGSHLVHSFWDHHRDWRTRVKDPYVVGGSDSLTLMVPVPYVRLYDAMPNAFVAPAKLQNAYHAHPPRRVRDPAAISLLRSVFDSALSERFGGRR